MARVEEQRIRAGDAQLAGSLILPDDPPPAGRRGRYPNVLLLPSWLPRDRDGAYDRTGHPGWFAPISDGNDGVGILARLAAALADRGVASLRADPRGCGRSEGAWEGVDLFTRIDDARDQLSAMRSHGALDLRRTGILGHGEGSTVALSVAIGDPAVGTLTLIGPAARAWDGVLRRAVAQRSRAGIDREHPLVAAIDRWSEDVLERAQRREESIEIPLPGAGRERGRLRLKLAGVHQAVHTPPLALATMLHRSLGLVHGELDAWTDPDESALLERVLRDGGNAPTRRLVAGAGHDLAEADDALIGEIAADLAARLVPRELPPALVAIDEMS